MRQELNWKAELTIENLEDKYAILDVKATLSDGTRVDIEIQVVDQYNMEQRTLYYLSRLYSEQLTEGGKYTDLNKAITINILNFNLIPNKRYHNQYLLKEIETNEIFSDLLQVHTIELQKFNKTAAEINDDLESWVEFLKEPNEEVVEMLAERVPEIREAFQILRVVSRDKDTRRDAEIRAKALSDKATSLAGAEGKGLKKGIEGMLDIKFGEAGLSIMDQIRKISDLTKLETIKEAIRKAVTIEDVLKYV